MAKSSKRMPRGRVARKESKADRIRRITALGYRALALGVSRAHLSESWMRHFKARSDRLFEQAILEWAHA